MSTRPASQPSGAARPPVPLRAASKLLFACCLVGLIAPCLLGLTYTERLATRPSGHLVSVEDHGARPGDLRRPRRAVVVVLDGLGHEDASRMRSLDQMRARGQCRKMDVGSLPLSRPVYGAISTGVEQDRGGALINDSTTPHRAESIWQIAQESGLSVAAVSELDWWQRLFPRGFASYRTPPRTADYFRLAPAADLLLVHPLYIDETGHEHGADSDAYRAAVARADDELLAFMGTLDLDRDLLVVTSDHGHSLRGGHGGRQDRVAYVLSCYAGVGVQHRPQIGAMHVTSLAPSLALLLGLRFPAAMRAGDDDLDVLWEIAEPRDFSDEHLAERRRTVERFRAENRAALARSMPDGGGSWTAFYDAVRRRQASRALPFLGVLALLLWVHGRGHQRLATDPRGGRSGSLFGVAWWLGCGLAAWALQTGVRGSFDMSSIDTREGFIGFTLALGIVVGAGAVGLHLLLRRSTRALLWDASVLSVIGTVLCLAHPWSLGWHLDFRVPEPALYFFPFFATLFLVGLNLVGLLLCLLVTVGPLRERASPRAGAAS